MTDPSEEQIIDDFMNWLSKHPGVTPEDLGVVMHDEYTPYGNMKVFTSDAILNSRYLEIANRKEPEIIN